MHPGDHTSEQELPCHLAQDLEVLMGQQDTCSNGAARGGGTLRTETQWERLRG